MAIADVFKIPVEISLAVIAAILAISMLASVRKSKKDEKNTGGNNSSDSEATSFHRTKSDHQVVKGD